MRGIRELHYFPDSQTVAFRLGLLSCCALDLTDWQRLETLGESATWTVGRSGGRPVPMVGLPGQRPAIVARLLLGAGRWQQVRYRNGDAFDLRRGNLILFDRSTGRAA